MKILLLSFLAFFAFCKTVDAQTSISVDINKASLEWVFNQGAGGVADKFNVKCGPSTGQYTKTTERPNTARTIPIKDAITGIGSWFCTVSAANTFGESPNSNEVSFTAGTVPVPPTNLTIKAQ